MRKLLILTLVAALGAPSLASADRPSRRAPRNRATRALVDRSTRALVTAPPSRSTPSRPPVRVGWGPSNWTLGLDAVPFWLGWSWGWGYYPLWPRPYYPGHEAADLPEDAYRLSAKLEAYGAGSVTQAAGTLALTLEGHTGGLHASASSFTVPATSAGTGPGSLGIGEVAATWSVLASDTFRLRLEAGASMLSTPADGGWAGAPYANTVTVGPQIGVSGHLGLLGPFGFEGHARVTPYPVPVVDTRAALAVRGGPIAVTAGWRVLDVAGDGTTAPSGRFSGPELGLQLVF
jgi:hypothetical protein